MLREGYMGTGITAKDRYCRNCGQELRPGDRFCPNCGQPTAAAQMPPLGAPTSPQPPPQRGIWSAGRVLLLVILAPVLLAIAWFMFQFTIGFLSGLLGF